MYYIAHLDERVLTERHQKAQLEPAGPEKDDPNFEERIEKLTKNGQDETEVEVLWAWLNRKLDGFDAFIEALLMEGSVLSITWDVVKATGKLAFYILKNSLKMLISPLTNFVKMFKREKRKDLFSDTKTLHFDRRNKAFGWVWAIVEGAGLAGFPW